MKLLTVSVLVVSLTGVLTGCGFTGSAGEHFQMSGTPQGIRAFGDTLNGAMKTAKESPNAHSQYFGHRKNEEQQITIRHDVDNRPGLFQKMFFSEKSEAQGS